MGKGEARERKLILASLSIRQQPLVSVSFFLNAIAATTEGSQHQFRREALAFPYSDHPCYEDRLGRERTTHLVRVQGTLGDFGSEEGRRSYMPKQAQQCSIADQGDLSCTLPPITYGTSKLVLALSGAERKPPPSLLSIIGGRGRSIAWNIRAGGLSSSQEKP